MKKIIISLSIIAIIAGITLGVTGAYFSDTETSTGNSFTTGNLTVRLGGENNQGNKFYDPEKFFNVENMVPGGECKTAYVEIKNNGTIDMLFRAYATNATEETSLLDYLNMNVTLNPSDYSQSLAGDLYGPADTPIYNGTLRDMYGSLNALDNLDAAFNDGWPLNSGYVAIYKVEACLDFDTPNSLQGSNMTADLQVDATQFDGQPGRWDVQW